MIISSVAVIDAGVGIFQVVADPLSEKVDARWTSWARGGIQVCAPRLWLNERDGPKEIRKNGRIVEATGKRFGINSIFVKIK